MRLITVCAAIVLAGCAPTTITDLLATGTQTARYDSDKTPMEFAECAKPAYDLLLRLDPAHTRPTPTGLVILKTTSAMDRLYILGMISVDAVEGGSSIIGVATDHGATFGQRLREIEDVIRQCA